MDGKKNRVVIVGGGIAGGLLAKNIQFDADVVLIDTKEYFEITWAELRAKVEPSFGERSVINHSEYLSNGRLVVSSATNITEAEILTADGRSIPYDYLVIATGHSDPTPNTRSNRLQQFHEDNQKIKNSKSILIIGGGPTGVELAGEIVTDFPGKKVTLVHKGSRLLEFIGAKAGSKALDWLTSKKVEVLLEQSINLDSTSDEDHVFRTSSGETISADCYFLCVGKPVGSAWLKETILKDCLDRMGRVVVDEHLKVKGRSNVFAIGDITNIPEIKQGYLAQKHAKVVAKNLKVLMGGGKESCLSSYKPASATALVSLGRKEGVAQLPLATISGCIPGLIKSRDLFVGKTRKEMGFDSRGP